MKIRTKSNKVLVIVTTGMCLFTSTLSLANKNITIDTIYQGGENAININHEIQVKNKKATISIFEADLEGSNQIESILLPNNKVVKKDRASYKVSKSGTYIFKILQSNGSTIIYPVEVNLENKSRTISLYNSTSFRTNKNSYTITQGDSLKLEYNVKGMTQPKSVKVSFNGSLEMPYYYDEYQSIFRTTHLQPGKYEVNLDITDMNNNKYYSEPIKITILSEGDYNDTNDSIDNSGSTGNSNNNSIGNNGSTSSNNNNNSIGNIGSNSNINNNPNASLKLDRNSYSVGIDDNLKLQYTLPQGESVKNIKLIYDNNFAFAYRYDSYEAVFKSNQMPEGTHKAKLSIVTFNNLTLESPYFDLTVGNPTTNPGNSESGSSTPTQNTLTLNTTNVSFSKGDLMNVAFNINNPFDISYLTLTVGENNIPAMNFSNNNGTFSTEYLSVGHHKATLTAYGYNGEIVQSESFNITVNEKVQENQNKPTVSKSLTLTNNNLNVLVGDSLQIDFNSNFGFNSNTVELELSSTNSTDRVTTLYSYFANSNYALFNTSGIQPGKYTVKIKVRDYDGNLITSNSANLTIKNSSTSQNSTYTPKTSMSASAHEGIPNGAPADWKYKPRIENLTRPYGWNAVGLWGQIYLEEGHSYPTNTGIEIRNFKLYGYSETNKEWKLITHAMPSDIFYKEDFAGDANKVMPSKIKKNTTNKSLIVKLDKDTKGYNLHPFSQQINTRNAGLPDVKYVISQMDVRLVKWDPNGIDDRDKAHFVANVGGDWWRNVGDVWQPDWSTNVGIAQGQFRTVEKDWKTCYMTTIPVNNYDQIIKETTK